MTPTEIKNQALQSALSTGPNVRSLGYVPGGKAQAATNQERVDSTAGIDAMLEAEATKSERKIILIGFGISIGVVLLLVLAVKYKIIQL